jgi:hypothetical protein
MATCPSGDADSPCALLSRLHQRSNRCEAQRLLVGRSPPCDVMLSHYPALCPVVRAGLSGIREIRPDDQKFAIDTGDWVS